MVLVSAQSALFQTIRLFTLADVKSLLEKKKKKKLLIDQNSSSKY